MTLTGTDSTADTDNESDNDWATETLGASGTISGGSDCFTVSDLDTSTYNDSGSGPMLTMKVLAATPPSTLSGHRRTSFTKPSAMSSGPAARSAPAIQLYRQHVRHGRGSDDRIPHAALDLAHRVQLQRHHDNPR